MVPTIEPTLTIPLGKSLLGHAPFTQLQFAGDPAKLFVYESTYDYPWYRVLQWHAPTIAAIVLVLAAFGAMWVTWRVWRRPRARGLHYCRECNHELTAPNAERVGRHESRWLGDAACCPECGVRTQKPPLVGAGAWRRLRVPLAVAIALIASASATLGMTLTRYPAAWRFAFEPTWPMAGLEKYARSLAMMRTMSMSDRSGVRICRIDPATGATRELVRVWRPGLDINFVSDDGRWVVLSVGRERNVMIVVDAISGERRNVSLQIEKDVYARLVAFSSDSKRAYMSASDWRSRDRQRCTLFCLELEAGVVRAVDEVEVQHPSQWLDRTSGESMFVVRDDDKGLSWVHHQMYGKAGSRLDVFRRRSGDGIEEIELKDTANGVSAFAMLNESRDLVEFQGLRRDGTWTVDLKTRKVTSSASRSMYLPKHGYLNWPPNGLLVRNWSQEDPIAILRAPLSDSPSATPQLSRDGKWVAATVTRAKHPPVPGVPRVAGDEFSEIRVWDLNQIPTTNP